MTALDKRFKKPKDWTPGVQSFFAHYKRLPRKRKKKIKKYKYKNSDLHIFNWLWYIQHIENPDYNLFLINLVIESYKN